MRPATHTNVKPEQDLRPETVARPARGRAGGALRTLLTTPRGSFWTMWAAVALLSIAWAMSSPVGGSPDEPQHIVKAASVARGEFIGAPTDQPAVRQVTVPVGIADQGRWTCHVFNPTVGASCQGEFVSGLEPAPSTTSAGLYNPTFYLLVGWPTLFIPDSQVSILAMRTLGALLSSLFFALGFVYLRSVIGRIPAALATALVLTPMVVFLAGAVNPNTLEVATGFALISVLLAVIRGGGRPTGRSLLVIAVSGAILANDRGLSPVWMLLIAILATLSTAPARLGQLLRVPSVVATLAVLALAGGFALWWLLTTGSLGSMGSFAGAGETPPSEAFFAMIARVFDPGLIGIFGWLAYPAPSMTYIIWTVLIGGLIVAALILARGRALLAFIVALLGMVLIPATTQALAVQASGYIWQGRYGLIGLALVIVMAAVAVGDRGMLSSLPLDARSMPRAVLLLGLLVGCGHVLALYNTGRHYVLGTTGESAFGFLIDGPWQPPGSLLLWLVVALLGVALMFAIALPSEERSSTAHLSLSNRPSVQRAPGDLPE